MRAWIWYPRGGPRGLRSRVEIFEVEGSFGCAGVVGLVEGVRGAGVDLVSTRGPRGLRVPDAYSVASLRQAGFSGVGADILLKALEMVTGADHVVEGFGRPESAGAAEVLV